VELSHGTEIAGRYRLSRLIGEGGMGTVWVADDSESGEQVALKFVKDSKGSGKLRRRLLREAKAACAVRHPSVVQVHDIIELDDGSPVMVMEFLEGESLAAKLQRDGDIALGELTDMMQRVVSAVGTAHALGVVHRDLKPENIFLAQSNGSTQVKILDFGIAKLAPSQLEAAQSTELTRTGSLLGTPCYMAPEQVWGERDIDHRADIWSLGMIMYEALSGILPTRADNVGQVMKIITTRAIWPLEQAVPDLPADIAELVNRMLERERDKRPQDLREVRELLANHTQVDTPAFGEPAAPVSERDEPDSEPLGRLAFHVQSRADPLGETSPSASLADSIARLSRGEAVATERRVAPQRRLLYALVAAVGAIAAGWALWPTQTEETQAVEAATATEAESSEPTAEEGAEPAPEPAVDEEPEHAGGTPAGPPRPEPAAEPTRPRRPPRAPAKPAVAAKPKATTEPTAQPTAPVAPVATKSSYGGIVDTAPF
jgi:serine/threonine-protein kinase